MYFFEKDNRLKALHKIKARKSSSLFKVYFRIFFEYGKVTFIITE